MINLLPTKEKKDIATRFYLHLTATFFVVLSMVIAILAISSLPAYFISSVKLNSINQKLAIQKDTPVPSIDFETTNIINNLNNKLDIIDKAQADKFVVSKRVINEIMLRRMPDIKLFSITFTNGTSKIVNIQGFAPSRERLLLFRQALEQDINFKNVDLPISSFIKGKDIEFSLNLTIS